MRKDKTSHYLDIAQTWAQRGTCIRRNFGAIIVKNDEVIGSGYTGAPRGRQNCCDLNICVRNELNVPRGRMYELCRSVHAEQNAIIQAPRQQMIDSTLYLVCIDYNTGEIVPFAMPCTICKRLIINSGIKEICVRVSESEYKIIHVEEFINDDESLKYDGDMSKVGY